MRLLSSVLDGCQNIFFITYPQAHNLQSWKSHLLLKFNFASIISVDPDPQYCLEVNTVFLSFCWQEERTSAAPAGDGPPPPACEGVLTPGRRSEAARTRRYQVRKRVARKQCCGPEEPKLNCLLSWSRSRNYELRLGSKPKLRLLFIYQRLSIN